MNDLFLEHNTRGKYRLLLGICLGLWLVACSRVATTPFTITPRPSLAPTLTSIPRLTSLPTPQSPVAVLLASPEANQAEVNSLQVALNDIVVQNGLHWQVRDQLTAHDLVPELRLVVALPPDPGLAELVAAAPETQFLAVDIPGLDTAPNLTIIMSDTHLDQQGFLAGYIAAMLTDEWRVGVISLSDTVEGRSARTGFINGVIYFCGLCRQDHPPFYDYPMYFELPSTATSAQWQEAANYMVDHYVRTVYVYPGAGDENMLSILASAKINILSSGDLPESIGPNVAVSLNTDPLPLIQEQVRGLLDGNLAGGRVLQVPIRFSQVNPALFTPGKQRLAEQVLSDLQAGFIDTDVDLTTGENKP
jgi:hypothetical protein